MFLIERTLYQTFLGVHKTFKHFVISCKLWLRQVYIFFKTFLIYFVLFCLEKKCCDLLIAWVNQNYIIHRRNCALIVVVLVVNTAKSGRLLTCNHRIFMEFSDILTRTRGPTVRLPRDFIEISHTCDISIVR